MIGDSPPMREVYQFIAKAAPSDSTVLITGESGTGKELVARAIHRNSRRSSKPFVAINCAALTEALLESELFGHEKGAFTGAISQKKGKLEVADRGTVFLDEMGELAPAIQAKLLRVLQDQQFERVGGTRPIKVDIRLIAATNRDIDEAVQTGIVRRDLYYRLNVVSMKMPPLRERGEDIRLLARYFARKCAEKSKRKISGISAEAEACLLAYDWPGNVRELENAIERAVVLGSTEVLLPEDLPEPIIEVQTIPPNSTAALHDAVRESKKQIILKALDQTDGDYSEAARLLGLHVNNLHRLIRNLDLKQQVKIDRSSS
jgi:transcriptional regulator with GAF, ATPase, and Fis domain